MMNMGRQRGRRSLPRANKADSGTAIMILGAVGGLISGIILAPVMNAVFGIVPGVPSWLGWIRFTASWLRGRRIARVGVGG